MADERSGASVIGIGEGERRADAYRALPASGRGRAALVLGDAADGGLAREACDRLAREGFVALAPETQGADAERAGELAMAGVEALFREDASDGARVGVLGFGAGAGLALLAAARERRIGAVAIFDAPVPDGLDAEAIAAPVLAWFGASGSRDTKSPAAALEARLGEAGVRLAVRVRDGAAPGYMDPSRADEHDAAGAAEAWDQLLAFFRAEL